MKLAAYGFTNAGQGRGNGAQWCQAQPEKDKRGAVRRGKYVQGKYNERASVAGLRLVKMDCLQSGKVGKSETRT